MAHNFSRTGTMLWWLLPLAVLTSALGWETHWWKPTRGSDGAVSRLAANAVLPSLLPEYGIEGGIAGRSETVQRTLFNPTRRPAPAAPSETADKSAFQKGQFTFVGTSLTGDRRVAFLREIAGGKSRIVGQGDQINGVTVAFVSPDRVRLQLGAQSEELQLSALADGRRRLTQPPAVTPNAVPTLNAAPNASYLQGAPVAPPTLVDAATQLQEGQPVPNPD